MAVPRNRHSIRRTRTRRAHDAKAPKAVVVCKNCGASKRSHTLCNSCGHYAGKEVLKMEEA